MSVLPVEWNRDWNGGKMRMVNFSDAPIPVSVLVRGDRKRLKAPHFELEIPEALEIKDAFCPLRRCYGRETPDSSRPIVRDGVNYRCFHFNHLRYFAEMSPTYLDVDAGGSVSLVLGPKPGNERCRATHTVVCRLLEGERVADERTFEMEFRPRPKGLKSAKEFFALSWNCVDRYFSDDAAMARALDAYEAAGLTVFGMMPGKPEFRSRLKEIRAQLERRPHRYVFFARLGSLWHAPVLRTNQAELEKMGGTLSKVVGWTPDKATYVCPEFFVKSPELRKKIENRVREILDESSTKDGDWVAADMEPWQPDQYCFCDRCLKAFAEFAKLDRVPTCEETRRHPDEWAEFRTLHNAHSLAVIRDAVKKYNPTLPLVDYDYIMNYGDADHRKRFIRGCAKDALLNEQYIDGHLCSYYHKLGVPAFKAMRNNVRALSKWYVPVTSMSGLVMWLRKDEVMSPKRIHQFALACFVNGCRGYEFYSGNYFDGEILEAMMAAQDQVARYEDLPWGKRDGQTVPKCDSRFFVSASTVRPDGTEVVALFNYDEEHPIEVEVSGERYELPPYGVRFVEIKASPFQAAVPVWTRGAAEELNSSVRFKARFDASESAAVLRITGTSAYRIRLNGEFVGYGPARSPKGFFRVDEWPLDQALRKTGNILEIEAAGYNCNSYCFLDQPAFVQAEVASGGRVLAATAESGGGFAAETTERVRKVPRYSFQRTFAEAYRLNGKPSVPLKLERRPPVKYLERIASYPRFKLDECARVISRASVKCDPSRPVRSIRFVDAKLNGFPFKAFAPKDLEVNLWELSQRLHFTARRACAGNPGEPIRLNAGESAMLDAGLDDCGFAGMKVRVSKPGRLHFLFDEILVDGEIPATHAASCNLVEWRFETPGTYLVETFEPYVFRYGSLVVLDGAMTVSDFHIRTYKNPDAGRATFRCSDPALEKIFAAARETFAQNAVDVFTDCPGRERAGWLCDSFFIARVNRLLTGDSKLERLFFENFTVPEHYENLEPGAIPMCYPADHTNGVFIPNWAMWMVIQAEEYWQRSGDRATIDALKPRFLKFVDYLKRFRNADGLLEKLPSWVFVEWSHANDLVQDVNYPSNMMWAEVLDVLNRLYGMPELAVEAERVRETVRRQSWTGAWFCDNAVRQSDGTLKLSGECTETCQYYAFYFRTATPATHSELWRTLVTEFGPKRLKADLKSVKSHPEIAPSNAFIGNYLRLECLSREGRSDVIMDETRDYFLYMAERTGTLWEMSSPTSGYDQDFATASCNHGFASHAAVYLFRDILGVKSVDLKSRKAEVVPPKDLNLDWIEATLPLSPADSVSISWRKGQSPVIGFSGQTRPL